MALPTPHIRPQREFSGQRFARHVAEGAPWVPWRWLGVDTSGFVARDTGIGAATASLATARIVRADPRMTAPPSSHDGEFQFLFVLSGALELRSAVLGIHTLHEGDSATIPAGAEVGIVAITHVEFLEVRKG